MATIKRYLKALKDYFTKGEAGDAAFIETEFYGLGTNPQLLAQLQDFAGYYPTIDLEQLRQLPEGTLGYEYSQHMLKYEIQPLEISPDLQEEADRNCFALRYTLTHDIFHILLGFDTSFAGEMGVYGFTVAQNYSKMLSLAELPFMLIFSIIAPTQIRKIFANNRRGKALGKQAQCLLAYPFEENWARPISDIRAELGLVLNQSNRSEHERENSTDKNQSQGFITVTRLS